MDGLKPCPFCGGEAEIYKGRTKKCGKYICDSKNEALSKLDEYKKIGNVVNYSIREHKYSKYGSRWVKTKWAVRVDMQVFIPRCRSKGCIGRTQNAFPTESAAADAWNRRAGEQEERNA